MKFVKFVFYKSLRCSRVAGGAVEVGSVEIEGACWQVGPEDELRGKELVIFDVK